MYQILEEMSNRLVKYVKKKSVNGVALLESREVCLRYSLDNVAACVFGVEGRCFDEEYPLFRKLADDFLSPGSWQSVKTTFAFTVPILGKILRTK